MKLNTKILLLALWRDQRSPSFALDRIILDILISELTNSGRRSLYNWLVSQNLLIGVRAGSSTQYAITGLGINRLMDEFPALNSHWREWKGDWKLVVFCEPPKGDPQFRNLRKQCIDDQAIVISRGIYAFASQIPPRLLGLIRSMYGASVSVVKISHWEEGLDPSIFITKNGLQNLGNLYSGVSREIDQLLGSLGNKKGLTGTQKPIVREIYNRMISVLEIDPGYTRYYYPAEFSAQDVILKLQHLLRAQS